MVAALKGGKARAKKLTPAMTAGILTAALFEVGKFLIGLYIGRTGLASVYGAAGSLVIVFVWVYYSAQIFLLGAEFTWVYTHRHGSRAGQARCSPRSKIASHSTSRHIHQKSYTRWPCSR